MEFSVCELSPSVPLSDIRVSFIVRIELGIELEIELWMYELQNDVHRFVILTFPGDVY